jgi:ElaB/YqjD/DUF883 family membrane-anchored ribosome-binding protein
MSQADSAGRPAGDRAAADHLKEAFASAGSAAREKAREIVDASRTKLDEMKKKSLEELYGDAKAYIRENPGKTLVGALVAGFLLGRLLRRR